MKKVLFGLVLSMMLIFDSCNRGGDAGEAFSLFPLPCQSSRNSYVYYVDEEGYLLEDLSDMMESLGCKEAALFSDGLLKVHTYSPYAFYFLNRNGEVVLSSDMFDGYERATDFSEGIAFINRTGYDSKSKAIDKQGNVLFELDGIPRSAFYKGYAYFSHDPYGKVGIIDRKGNVVVEPPVDRDTEISFPYGYPPLFNAYIREHRCDKKQSIDNTDRSAYKLNGELLFKDVGARYYEVFDDEGYISFMGENGLYGLADPKGNVVIEPKFHSLTMDGEWYLYVKPDTYEAGWVDRKGKVKCTFDFVLDKERRDLHLDPRPYMFNGGDFFMTYSKDYDEEGNRYYNTTLHDKKGGFESGIHGYLIETPFVNGVAVGYNHKERTCALISLKKVKRGLLFPELNGNRFAFAEMGENIYSYAMYPYARWRGFR